MSKHTSTPAVDALQRAGVTYTLHSYEHHDDETQFGAEASRQLGIDPARMFKTLVLSTGPRTLAVAVVAVADRLDPKAFAAAVGEKRAELAEPARAQRSTGYVVGGISPLGQRTVLPTVVDTTIEDFATVFVSAGRRGLQLELAPADLIATLGAVIAPIAR